MQKGKTFETITLKFNAISKIVHFESYSKIEHKK